MQVTSRQSGPLYSGCPVGTPPIHALREANVDSSRTSTFSALAIFSSPAMGGPDLEPLWTEISQI
jgi:hypothetical protein